jgi:hypothetical protein
MTFASVLLDKSAVDTFSGSDVDQVTGDVGVGATAIGLIVGAVLLVLIVVALLVACMLTRKRNRRASEPIESPSAIVMPICSAEGFADSPREESSMMSARESQQLDANGYTRPPAALFE